jgi:peptide/nickel transport system substrate-binding protein
MVALADRIDYHVHTRKASRRRRAANNLAARSKSWRRVAHTRAKGPETARLRPANPLATQVHFLTRAFKALLVLVVIAALGWGVWRVASRGVGSPTPAEKSARISRGGELVASLRSDPSTYNRYAPDGARAATELLSLLLHARLVRVNRSTDDLEPMLAEGWTRSDDGLTYTLRLRPGVRFSDGAPFTSDDVVFSFRAAYDESLKSSIGASMRVNGKALAVSAPDPHTVVLGFPEPFAPGLRLLDNLPILPKHRLGSALEAGRFAEEWVPSKPVTDVVGLGPFVLVEHVSGQRVVLERNPHYFRRDAQGQVLPYLDRLTIAIVPDQTAEGLRLEAGEIDLMSSGEIRPQDYSGFKRSAESGAIRLIEAGIGLDPDFLAFNLTPSPAPDKQRAWLRRREFRQAVSWAVSRQAIIDTVYLGAAVPISGPVTPGNRTWFDGDRPAPGPDPARARQLLATLGLRDINGDGSLEDQHGAAVRFSIMTQAGHNRERVATVIQEQLRQVGVAVEIVALDPGGLFTRWQAGDYDAMYFGLQSSVTDPWLNSDFWLSSGAYHFWNPAQKTPGTAWESRIDTLMRDNAAVPDLGRRRQVFAEIQGIFAEELPLVYFVAPRLMLATSQRVVNPTPAPQIPQLLWSADTLGAATSR